MISLSTTPGSTSTRLAIHAGPSRSRRKRWRRGSRSIIRLLSHGAPLHQGWGCLGCAVAGPLARLPPLGILTVRTASWRPRLPRRPGMLTFLTHDRGQDALGGCGRRRQVVVWQGHARSSGSRRHALRRDERCELVDDALQQRGELGELALVRRRRRPGARGGLQTWLWCLAVRVCPGFEQLFDQGLPGQPARTFQGFNFLLQRRAQPNLDMLAPRERAGCDPRKNALDSHMISCRSTRQPWWSSRGPPPAPRHHRGQRGGSCVSWVPRGTGSRTAPIPASRTTAMRPGVPRVRHAETVMRSPSRLRLAGPVSRLRCRDVPWPSGGTGPPRPPRTSHALPPTRRRRGRAASSRHSYAPHPRTVSSYGSSCIAAAMVRSTYAW